MSLRFEPVTEFNEADHIYKVEGIEVPSVTTVLQEMGFMKALAFYTDSGANRGTYIHSLVEQYNLGTMDWGQVGEYLPEIEAYIQAKEELKMEVLLTEQRMFNRSMWVAGCADNVSLIRNEEVPYLIDLKTGAPAKWHVLQLILYGAMIKWQTPEKEVPLKMAILYINKKGKYKFVEYQPEEAYFKGAYGAVAAYHIRRTMI